MFAGEIPRHVARVLFVGPECADRNTLQNLFEKVEYSPEISITFVFHSTWKFENGAKIIGHKDDQLRL